MSIINKCFRDSAVSKEIKDVCDSDIFGNIAKAINNHMPKLNQAMNYLTEEDDISMKLRVMTLPVADKNALLIYLMTLDSSFATKINRVCKDGSNPALHFSMYKGMEVFIRLIAHANANLDIVGLKGCTPLIIACENCLPETVKMLVNNGARAFNHCDDSGWAALHYACQIGNPEIVEVLVQAGVDVNIMSVDKLMPIHLAISTAQAARMSPTAPNGIPWNTKDALKCLQILVNNGADLDYVCPYGFSGMSFLKMMGLVK